MALWLAAVHLGKLLPQAIIDHVILPLCGPTLYLYDLKEDNVPYMRWLLGHGADPHEHKNAAIHCAIMRGLLNNAVCMMSLPIELEPDRILYLQECALSEGQLPILQWMVEKYGYRCNSRTLFYLESAINEGH